MWVISIIGVFLWLRTDNARIMTLFHQSNKCDARMSSNQDQENCYEELKATIQQVDQLYSGYGQTNRFGASSGNVLEVIAMDLQVTLPDGSTNVIRTNRGFSVTPYMKTNPNWLERGDVITLTRWRNRIISIKINHTPDELTSDHPTNETKFRISLARTICSLLFIVFVVWSGYEILNPRA